MLNTKPALTPMVESFFTGLDAEENTSPMEIQRYQEMIGSLMYLAFRTRPDILSSVLILARFQKAPTSYCHRATKRIMRYLKGTTNLGLLLTSGEPNLIVFVDADYAADTKDRKSMSGFVTKLGSATVNWGSKKQCSVALSTCEAEYHAMSVAAQEIVWMRRVLQEAGISVADSTPLLSDNQSGIAWATGEKSPSVRAKHIDIRVHFIRELVARKEIEVLYVPSEENDADMMTKPLGRNKLQSAISRISLLPTVEEEC